MVTYIIIALNVIFSFIGFGDKTFFSRYMFNPYRVHVNKNEWYTLFTHAFLHADLGHLFFNMFTFYNFGLYLEQQIFPHYFGHHATFLYVILYVGGIMVSSIPSFEKQKNNPNYNAVGASGAVSAVIFSFILIEPNSTLNFFLLPIDIPASLFGILYLLITWYLSKRGGGRIAHDAHLWGSLFGFAFTLILHPGFFPLFINQLISIF